MFEKAEIMIVKERDGVRSQNIFPLTIPSQITFHQTTRHATASVHMKAGTFLLEWDKIGALWVKLDEEKVDGLNTEIDIAR